jgi:hypothetical protein
MRRAADRAPALHQRTPAPTIDHAAVEELLRTVKSSSHVQSISAINALSQMLEEEEMVFRDVAGDPYAIPNQRNGFGIGKMLALIKVTGEANRGLHAPLRAA